MNCRVYVSMLPVLTYPWAIPILVLPLWFCKITRMPFGFIQNFVIQFLVREQHIVQKVLNHWAVEIIKKKRSNEVHPELSPKIPMSLTFHEERRFDLYESLATMMSCLCGLQSCVLFSFSDLIFFPAVCTPQPARRVSKTQNLWHWTPLCKRFDSWNSVHIQRSAHLQWTPPWKPHHPQRCHLWVTVKHLGPHLWTGDYPEEPRNASAIHAKI